MIFSILDMLVAPWRIVTILCFSISQNQYLMVLFKLGKLTLLGKICSKFVFNLHIILQIWKSQHFLKTCHSLIDSSSIPLKVFFSPLNVLFRFVNGMVYYGLSLSSGEFGGSIYLNFVLTSLVEIPGNILVIHNCNRY